jgi:ketosteroid isomerase-like protein
MGLFPDRGSFLASPATESCPPRKRLDALIGSAHLLKPGNRLCVVGWRGVSTEQQRDCSPGSVSPRYCAAMSKENVEIVRRGAEAFARNDWDAAMAVCDPDIEWSEMPSLGPDASTYIGVEQVREAVQSWIQMWGKYDLEIVRYDHAADEVVILSRERGRGGASGAAVERQVGQVSTVREMKIVRVRLYGSWAEALEAAGLSE